MKQIKLNSIKVENMYGYATAEIDFTDGKNVIRNKMRYGKTTILNCVLFALGFVKGKYQPCIEEYPVKNLDSRVDMVLSVDGLNYTLRVESKQKWGAKDKESDEKVLVGNTLTYNFDGLECQLKDYKVKLADLFGVPYERIEMLVDIRYFNTDTTKWKWNDRREMVYSLLNVDEQTKEVASREEFAVIGDELKKGKTEAEIQKSLNAEKKRIADEQFKANVILNQKVAEYSSLSGTDFAELKKQKDSLWAEMQKLKDDDSSKRRDSLFQQVMTLKGEIQKINTKNDYAKMEWERNKAKLQSELDAITVNYKLNQSTIVGLQGMIKNATTALNQAKETAFPDSSTVCPTCGRKLEENQIKKAKEAFEKNTTDKIKELQGTLEDFTRQYEKAMAERDNLIQSGKAKRTELNEFDKNGYSTVDTNTLEQRLKDAQAALEKLDSDNEGANADKLNAVVAQYTEVVNKLSDEGKVNSLKVEIDGLKKSLIELAKTDSLRAQKQNALKSYIIAKAEKASEIINSSFNGIKFRLFKINGGLAENPIEPTFEVIHEISGYASQSHGQKIYSDICIGIALRKLYGVNLFMFVDEIQSVTDPYEYPFQTIELYTTADDVTDIKATKIKDLYTMEDTVK